MPTTYPVDYIGTALPNKILNEPHSISAANFRNFKVIIPEFAPFHVTGLIITHPATNYTLIEDQDYYLTHLYVEASKSIGHDIYGSISITSALTGVFQVTYQTVGGSWTLPANTITNVLANLAINPRVARWTQVALYPAVFPSINHNTDAEDLTGMTEVVQAIELLETAIENQQQIGGVSDPYASIIEAKAGLAVNRVMNPAGTYAAITEAIDAYDASQNTGGGAEDSAIVLFNKDFFGIVSFINDGYKVVYENSSYTALKGLAYIDGLRNEIVMDTPLTVDGTPADVWLESYFSTITGDVEHVISVEDGELIVNVLPYSSDLSSSYWTGMQSGVTSTAIITPNLGYNADGKRVLGRLTMTDTTSIARLKLISERLTLGSTYAVSFYARSISGNTDLTVKLGLAGHTASVKLTQELQRFTVPLVYAGHDQLSFRLGGAGSLELGDIQGELTSSLLMLTNPTNLASSSWVKDGATVSTNVAPGPWNIGPYVNKLAEAATNSKHAVSGSFYAAVGARYKVSFIVKQAERDVIEISTTGAGAVNGISRLTISTSTINVSHLAHRNLTITSISEDVSVTGYKLVEFYIYGTTINLIDLSINLYNSASTYTGVSGSGVLISSLLVTCDHTHDVNLLRASDGLNLPIWLKDKSYIDRRSFINSIENPTAFKLCSTVNTGEHSLYQTVPGVGDTDYVFSGYFKAAELTKLKMEITGSTGGASYTVDLANTAGAAVALIGTGWSLASGNISLAGEGWIRLSIKAHSDIASVTYPITAKIYLIDTDSNISYTGDGIDGLLLDRLQLEVGTVMSASQQITRAVRPNDLIVSYADPATSYLAKARASFYDEANQFHRYVKLATILSSSSILDWRRVLVSNGAMTDKSGVTYIPITEGQAVIPGTSYWLKSGQTAILPSTQGLLLGAAFYFDKPLGSTVSIAVSDTVRDLIFAKNFNEDTIVSDSALTFDSDNPLTIIFNGSDYEARY